MNQIVKDTKPMTQKQAVDYFRDDANWETLESLPSGDFLLQRLKGTQCRRIYMPNHKEFFEYGNGRRAEIPVSKEIFYYLPTANRDGSIGFRYHGTSFSKDTIVAIVRLGLGEGEKQ